MKKISEYLKNKCFCLVGGEIEDLVLISQHFGKKLVCVGKHKDEHEAREYTVRVTDRGLTDHKVRVWSNRVEILETVDIIEKYPEKKTG